eukprot:gnl/Trimastix_PCT/4140.p1 GENE.gnl/Trimastix_PCT/4140~~gnl/Trimastix_PCT/4140.p1  ORF type:complete len:401 (+),score=45.76 gnl/Trimastix_PCT/4140:52-1254(+)
MSSYQAYDWEIEHILNQIGECNAHSVALQFPEGLLQYACQVVDALRAGTHAFIFILSDVAYGACCIADKHAREMGADLMIHFGHHGLLPPEATVIPVVYIPVQRTDIDFEKLNLREALVRHFEQDGLVSSERVIPLRMALLSTAQFLPQLKEYAQTHLGAPLFETVFPAVPPLPPGEALGCTVPACDDREVIVFVADGAFHVEAVLFAYPRTPVYRFDASRPTELHREIMDYRAVDAKRRGQIQRACSCRKIGIVRSTLGRQGSRPVVDVLAKHLTAPFCVSHHEMDEITPVSLRAAAPDIEAWIEVGCPRLALDWGTDYPIPVLTPHEALTSLTSHPTHEPHQQDTEVPKMHPMDHWSQEGGVWTHWGAVRSGETGRGRASASQPSQIAFSIPITGAMM